MDAETARESSRDDERPTAHVPIDRIGHAKPRSSPKSEGGLGRRREISEETEGAIVEGDIVHDAARQGHLGACAEDEFDPSAGPTMRWSDR